MHFTQNPIGSDDQLDLQDNAISFDYAMNSPAALWQDRFGKQHKTVQQALKDVGFKPAGFDFVSGGTLGIGDRDKCVFYPTDGYWYSWNGKLPYVVPANSSPTPGGKKGWGVVTRDERVVAREALRRTYKEVGLDLVEGSFEQGGVLVNSNDVLLQDRTGKVFSGPAGVVAAGTDPTAGGFVDVSRSLLRKDEGYVEAWRDEYPDDTDCIKAALISGACTIKLSNPVYNVRGGEIYVPEHVTLDLCGNTIRLKDNAGIYRKTIIELDSYSRIINGLIDGNYQNNSADFSSWVLIGDVPVSHGVYTSRLQTNGNVYKKAVGCKVDGVKVINTIRSNFVLTGENQNHGRIEADNTLTDHLIYWSLSDGVQYDYAVLSGICRAEAISIGTSGSGVSTVSPSFKFRGGITIFKNIRKSQFIVSGYDEEPIWIQGRDVKLNKVSGSFDQIYVDDTSLLNSLTGNGRRIAFQGLYTVDIGLIELNTVVVDASTVNNAYFLDVRGGADVSVRKYKAAITSKSPGYSFAISPLRCDSGSRCFIGTYDFDINSQLATNVRGSYVEDANVQINMFRGIADTGVMSRVQAVNQNSSITIKKVLVAQGFSTTETIIRLDSRIYEGRVIIENPRNIKSASLAASKNINAFNISELELFSENPSGYTIDSISGGNIGQRIRLIGDGKAARSVSSSAIKWQGVNELSIRPLAIGEAIELYLNTDGVWYEVPQTNQGSFILYRTASPIGAVIPLYLWQECLDQTNKRWYKATGTSLNTDWVALN